MHKPHNCALAPLPCRVGAAVVPTALGLALRPEQRQRWGDGARRHATPACGAQVGPALAGAGAVDGGAMLHCSQTWDTWEHLGHPPALPRAAPPPCSMAAALGSRAMYLVDTGAANEHVPLNETGYLLPLWQVSRGGGGQAGRGSSRGAGRRVGWHTQQPPCCAGAQVACLG